ncbi:thioredoxin family protein [Hymenobacter sp. BT186]|uniref:Thioredoxin family protein n=1 Tax=Hymenobacter telluris TaxID=2816474 RepID=A0A939F407_9BACT|nr:thioredoxin family protein [Hymenobacter telluris]MBO0360983.1 thioredoxin family protein [Hymenobacter telluris]MBW3377011.1 thioredoxin family protein [Hymenobacter norwichensis]
MRVLTLCLFALLLVLKANAQAPALTWNTDLSSALQQAKAVNKPVLAVFSGSDWCKPCIMLKQEVFDQPEFAQYAQGKLVLARFDFPRSKKNKLPADQNKRNEQAAAQLNKEGAFPLVVLLSPDGKVLAKTGYRPGGPAAYDAYLTQLLAKQ